MEIVETYQCHRIELSKGYYVYAYLDSSKPGLYQYGDYYFEYEPFYIGKGIRDRIFHHIKEAKGYCALRGRINYLKLHKINKIITETGRDPIIVILYKGIPETCAIEHEMALIRLIGRRDTGTGPLCNMTNGGEGGSGLIMSDSAKKKLSLIRKGIKLPLWIRKRISEAQIGRKHRPESIEKMCKAQKGHIVKESTREKLRKANIGKKPSAEALKKMSETHLKKQFKHSAISRELMSKNIAKFIYTLVSPTGEVFDNIYSISKFCMKIGVSRRTILRHAIANKECVGWKITRRTKCQVV